MTITQIQALYPHPVISNDDKVDGYCVGGAICLAHAESDTTPPRFPTSGFLAVTLRELNAKLDYERAVNLARSILAANDTGDFHHAWRLAALALGDTTTV